MGLGVVQYAIASFKYNRSLLSKRDRLKHTLSVKAKTKPDFKFPNAKPDQLVMIRKKMKLEHRRLQRKRFVALVVFMLIFIFTCRYFINQIKF